MTREIWAMQPRFARRQEKRAARLVSNPRFRAGYDFLLLREQGGEALGDLCRWWTEYQSRTEEPPGKQGPNARRERGARHPRRRRKRREPAT